MTTNNKLPGTALSGIFFLPVEVPLSTTVVWPIPQEFKLPDHVVVLAPDKVSVTWTNPVSTTVVCPLPAEEFTIEKVELTDLIWTNPRTRLSPPSTNVGERMPTTPAGIEYDRLAETLRVGKASGTLSEMGEDYILELMDDLREKMTEAELKEAQARTQLESR